MSSEMIANRKEIISKYIAENIKFDCNINDQSLKPVHAILQRFKTHLPDLEFLQVDDSSENTIILYTNYNFKFEIMATDDANTYGLIPKKCPRNNQYHVWLYPFEDKTTFFGNDYCDDCCSGAYLYINRNGYLLASRDDTYDIPFDITQCDYVKGYWPCALTGASLNQDPSDRDYMLQKFFDHLITNF